MTKLITQTVVDYTRVTAKAWATPVANWPDYFIAASIQLDSWVAGYSMHNPFDPSGSGQNLNSVMSGECCPDFSCCSPSCKVESKAERMETATRLFQALIDNASKAVVKMREES